MGFYSDVFFPWGMDKIMSKPHLTKYRGIVLKELEGKTLEIGFGTGLNLPHYPLSVSSIVIVDPNPGMNRKAQKRIQDSTIPVESNMLGGEKLPMEDESFDSVLSTWTLCSIPDVFQAIAEIRRVLKPSGKFFFIEHGLSPDTNVQKWQNRLTPWIKRITDGCHMNRDINQLLISGGFQFDRLELFYMENEPKVSGYTFMGIAVKA